MICDYCKFEEQELNALNLPCGYLVCCRHLEDQDQFFRCFVCRDHMIEKQACLDMAKNRKKLDQREFLQDKDFIFESCDKIDSLKKDLNRFVRDHLSKVIHQLDIQRELLKNNFNKLVDDYHNSLVKEIKDFETYFVCTMEPKVQEFNTAQIRIYLDNQQQNFKSKNEFISNLKKNKIDKLISKIKKFENIKFIASLKEAKFDMAELFGIVNSKELAEELKLCSIQLENKNPPPFSAKFNLKCQFGLNTFLELSTGELVSSCLWDPSNFLTVHSACSQIAEFPGHRSKFIFMFLADDDVIVTISEDYFIRAWKNFKCFKYIPLEREKIIAAELFKYNVITVSQTFYFKIISFSSGQIIKEFSLNLSQITLIKPLSQNFILTSHQNQAIVWNTDNLKEKERISFNGLASCIETVSANEYYIGSSNGQIIKWNRKPTFYPCHQGPVSCIRDCNNGKILSISCQDNTTKLWNGKNFDLLYEVSLCMPFVGKILNCSKFAYIDQQGKLYVSE